MVIKTRYIAQGSLISRTVSVDVKRHVYLLTCKGVEEPFLNMDSYARPNAVLEIVMRT